MRLPFKAEAGLLSSDEGPQAGQPYTLAIPHVFNDFRDNAVNPVSCGGIRNPGLARQPLS